MATKKQDDLQHNDKASVNPFANTKDKSTQVQNPSRNDMAQQAAGRGKDMGKEPRKQSPQRSNPQDNNPMSKDV
jgi:hypothetical protein